VDLKYVKELIQILEKSNLNRLTIKEKNGVEVTLEKGGHSHHEPIAPKLTPRKESIVVQQNSAEMPTPTKAAESEDLASSVKSPMVGTFYRSESPDAEPFVEVGSEVKVGDPICVIEAMKVMNEIKSDLSGKVKKICVEDGSPIEYGQPLIVVE